MASTCFFAYAVACFWLLPPLVLSRLGMMEVAKVQRLSYRNELQPLNTSIPESCDCGEFEDCCADGCIPYGTYCCGILAGTVHYCLPQYGPCSPCPPGNVCYDTEGQIIDKTCCINGICQGATSTVQSIISSTYKVPPPTPTGCDACSSSEDCCLGDCMPKGSECCGIFDGTPHWCLPGKGNCVPCPPGTVCHDDDGDVVSVTCTTTSTTTSTTITSTTTSTTITSTTTSTTITSTTTSTTITSTTTNTYTPPPPTPTGCDACSSSEDCCFGDCMPKGSECCGIVAGTPHWCLPGKGSCAPCPPGTVCYDNDNNVVTKTCYLPTPTPPPPPPSSTTPTTQPPPSSPSSVTPSSPTQTPSITPTTTTSETVCPRSTTNTDYHPATPLPVDYTWGCPPGSLCKPKKRCVLEEAPPAADYVCAPDECKPAPPLQPLQVWGEPIFSNETSFYILQDDYFNLNPIDFGLNFSLFVKVCPVLEKRTEFIERGDPPVPGPCYDECNGALLEAENMGKTPRLCDSDSDFSSHLSNCNMCIQYHGGGSGGGGGADFMGSPIQPEFQQWLGYCGTAVSSPISISSLPTTGSTFTAKQPSANPTRQPNANKDPSFSHTYTQGLSSDGIRSRPSTLDTGPTPSNALPTGSATATPGATILSSTIIPSSPPDTTQIQIILPSTTMTLDPNAGLGSLIMQGILAQSSTGSQTLTISSSDSTATGSSSGSTTKSSNSTSPSTNTATASTSRPTNAASAATAQSTASRGTSSNLALVIWLLSSMVAASFSWS